jgi:hypothetical protein
MNYNCPFETRTVHINLPLQCIFLQAVDGTVSREEDLVGLANRVLGWVCAISKERIYDGLGAIRVLGQRGVLR